MQKNELTSKPAVSPPQCGEAGIGTFLVVSL